MSSTIETPKQEGYQEDKIFTTHLLEELLSNPEITSEPGLSQILITIAKQAYFTTFPKDYDSSPDGINLSLLADYPRRKINLCLRHLEKSGNNHIRNYVNEFRETYL